MQVFSIIGMISAALIVNAHGDAKPPKYDAPEPLLPKDFAQQAAAIESASARRPNNWLRLANSSFLGGSRDLLIDLDTGIVDDRLRGMATPGNSPPPWKAKKGLISVDAVAKIRETIRMSLASGLVSEQCKQEESAAQRAGRRFIQRPVPDGVSELNASLDGRTIAAPQLSCQSRAVDNIWRVALQATQNMIIEPISK